MFKNVCILFTSVVVCTAALADVSINGYRYAIIGHSNNDMRGIEELLTENVQKSGLIVIGNASNLKEDEYEKTCAIDWSQYGNLTQYCRLTVKDFLTKTVVAHSFEWSRMRVGVPACIVGSVENAWKALKYSGFDEQAYLTNSKILFPPRPIVTLDEKQIREMSFSSPIEGIWTDSENKYSMGIIKDLTRKYGDFIGVILHSSQPTWSPGEIKMEIRETAMGNAFTADVYMANKSRVGTELVLDGVGGTIRFDTTRTDGSKVSYSWIKNYPKILQTSGPNGPYAPSGSIVSWTGSGFLLSASGLVATNYHVAGPASSLRVLFPKAGKEFKARIVLKDPNNDLAVLQLEGFSLAALDQTVIPYGFERTRKLSLGDPVFTIGFPLSNVLGTNAKFASGTISSKSGMGDDMVHLQIDVPVQHGNSGSPLFEAQGNVIGVIVSTYSEGQNVNFAIKSDYLINLTEMLPTELALSEAKSKPSPEQIEPFVCLITAQ